jgi:hypothetical protein
MQTAHETASAPSAGDILNRPRSALTLSQRFHFDAHGFVLLRGVLDMDHVNRLKRALYAIKADPNLKARGVYSSRQGDHYLHVGRLVEYDRAFLEYVAHPGLFPLVEEVIGGAIRLEESEAIINRRDPSFPLPEDNQSVALGFHTGTRHGWGTYYEQNRFHSIFVKTLAYLTDVGPDDGGTAVIPGSHRMSWPQREMIQAALEDKSLIHQVVANAGDVLLFPESLVHSTTAIRSDRERMIMVAGYTPPMVREWMGNEISPEFIETLPEAIRPLISGSDNWNWRRNYPS